MAIKIPKSLGCAADFCSKEVTRYGLTGVRVQSKGGKVRVSASDGKKLLDAVVRPDGQKEFTLPDDGDGNADFSCVVPRGAWKEAAETSEKGGAFRLASVNGHAVVKSSKRDTERLVRVARIDATYPNVASAFPKGEKVAEGLFDPRLLGEALLALARAKASRTAVKFEFFGNDKPMLITMRGDDADIRMLIMPMSAEI